MATGTNEKITVDNRRNYTASCESSDNAKLVYDGIKTHQSTTGPQWTLTADGGGSTEPSDSQALSSSYSDGFIVDANGTDKIAVEQEPDI